MRTLLFLSLVLLLSGSLSAQLSGDFDPRLTEVYERSYLERLATDHPVILQRLEYSLDHGWYLTEYPAEKGEADFPVIQVSDPDNINILILQRDQEVVRDFASRTMYRLAGTENVLVCESGRDFTQAFNRWREKE